MLVKIRECVPNYCSDRFDLFQNDVWEGIDEGILGGKTQ